MTLAEGECEGTREVAGIDAEIFVTVTVDSEVSVPVLDMAEVYDADKRVMPSGRTVAL